MANRRVQPVTYRPFKVDPLMSDGLLPVARDGGELEAKVAEAMFRVAGIAGERANAQAARQGALAGELAALDNRPRIDAQFPEIAPGEAFQTNDPVATDLPPEARAFLNTIASEESAGAYNVRYTPRGGAYFENFDQHPRIAEVRPDGRTSTAAGRYQFVASTWDDIGGGDFSPANQDRRAWQLAQRDYEARTGRPLLADLQAGGVTREMLSALTPTWEAFGKNRQNHIATYQDSLTRMVGRGEVAPPPRDVTPSVDDEVQAPRITVSGGWQPGGRDTVFGRAYDAAGTKTYLQALNTEIERTTSQVYDKYRDDPAMLAEAMQVLKGEQLREHVFDEIRAEYELTFDRASGRLVMQAQRELEKRQAEENRAAYLERTATLETERSQALAGLDPSDPTAVARLEAVQRQLDDHYEAGVAHDLISPTAAAEAKRKSRAETAAGFYLAQAGALHADEIGAFREQMKADFAAGGIEGLDAAGWSSLESRLVRLEDEKRSTEAQAAKDLATRGAKIAARVEMGFDYDPAELGRLQLDAGTAPDGEEIVATSLDMIAAAEVFRDRPIGEARAYVAELRAGMGDNPTDRQISVLQYAEERLATLEKMIAEDPVAYETATGRTALGTIDTSSPEALEASLTTRRDQMEAISERYGSPFQFFRPHERSVLAAALVENPDGFPGFVTALNETLGPRTAAALAELSEDAPTLAHAAGLAVATKDNSISVDVARALSAKAQGQFTAKMPGQDKFTAAAGPQFAGALGTLDRTRAATLATAQMLFEADANRIGFDPSQIDEPDTPAGMAWRRAVERSLGARYVGGRQTGGLGTVNGNPIVVPTGMEPALPQRLLYSLTDAMLEKLPPIASANGVPVTAAQIRRARLVTVGDGIYRVALGDPAGWDPQWLAGRDGSFWTIDMRRLEELAGGGESATGWRAGSRSGWKRE